ncbi:unnamed protein product [Blepharisma stoltei]|uniref:TmcB/TmcC TPR repeats domain-containing protein n=1 Tax=Blepharisma stoltei TaxID=1481888 RepID=A0AAU9JGY4_9CILI|nr:unnamed protein product [Blepharisma stoltei]
MLSDSNDGLKASLSIKALNWRHNSASDYIKAAAIEYVENFFKPKFNPRTRRKTQFAIEFSTNFINLLQVLSLTWYPDMNLRYWKQYSKYWKVMSYPCFDQILSSFHIYVLAFYISIAILWICVILVVLTSVLKTFKFRFYRMLIYLPSEILTFLSSIGYLPTLMIFLVTVKYSLLGNVEDDLYSPMPDNGINLGAFGAIFGIISTILLFLLSIIYELFTADIRHSYSDVNIKARADSNLDMTISTYKLILVIIYIFYGRSHHEWLLIFIIISSAILAYLTHKFNSYYNPMVNAFKVSKLCVLSSCSASFLFGVWMDNAGIILLLWLIAIPALSLIVFRRIYRLLLIPESTDYLAANQHIFELKIRKLLMDKSLREESKVVKIFAQIYKQKMFQRDKLLVAWEVYYYLHTINDVRLAKLRFSKMAYANSSLEGEIQEWRINKWIKKHHEGTDQIANNFLIYLIELEQAKKEDEILCRHLIGLWIEVCSSKPRLNHLENLVENVTKQIELVVRLYKKLIIQNHSKAYELYGSLLQQILRDSDKGQTILGKVSALKSEEEMSKYEPKLSKFDENYANILISADIKTFGIIVYVNDFAATILNETINNVIENNIHQYIPAPYNKNHLKYMKRFVSTCKNPQVDKGNSFFILDHYGYVRECQFLIRLTALNERLYFMVSMRPILSTRQVALISEDGLIYCHSQNFSKDIAEPEVKSLKFQYISSVIPSVDFANLPKSKPTLFKVGEIILTIIHCVKPMKNTNINYVLIIRDQEEVEKWTENEDSDQYDLSDPDFSDKDYNESKHIVKLDIPLKVTFQKKRISSSFSATEVASDFELTHESMKMQDIQQSEERTGSMTQSSSSNDYIRVGNHIINKSVKILKQFRLVLLLSILSVTATNIAIAIYISQAVDHSLSVNTYKDLGIVMYETVFAAENARSVYYSKNLFQDQNTTNYLNSLKNSLSLLTISQDALYSNLQSWSYCKSSDIIDKNLIGVRDYDSAVPKTLMKNLFDEISMFIDHTQSFISDVENFKDYTQDLKFVIANGLGRAFQKTNSSLHGLSDCEIEKIYENSNEVIILAVSGSALLGICMMILFLFIFLINKRYDQLWNFVIKITHDAYFDLNGHCFDRLSSVLGTDLTQEEINSLLRYKPKHKEVNFKIIFRHFSRLFVFIGLTIAYYLVIHQYLYPSCERYLIERPKLLSNYINRRSLIPLIDFWAKETGTFEQDYGLKIVLNNSYIFEHPAEELINTVEKLWDANHNLLSQLKYMSSELKVSLFQKKSNQIPDEGFAYGSFWYTNLLIFDSFLIENDENNVIENMENLGKRIANLEEAMSLNFEIIDKTSKDMITKKLNIITYTSLGYLMISVLMYLVFYLPYTLVDIKSLQKFQIIISVIPRFISVTEKSPRRD